ncbi:exodeoxyribonuclease VII small subunit [Proteocatella sphenisci]|uniref:exodeoxyribonuclease VII small subunit n=1 Tax=Proteocatella sphenisci TaxID=181070 RepID=UPI00048C7791|nr:exodeoxyribonuclease VII small subunit [Proteocatella sphenisci]
MKTKYESKIKNLDTIIKKLQESNIGLEDSIELYKDGIKLYHECSEELKNLELSIKTVDGENIIIE